MREKLQDMAQNLPFYRTVRGMKQGPQSRYSSWAYIRDKSFALDPHHYVRAYLLIQKDLAQLFEYVEPSDLGARAYSYRMHELLMRTCIEVEANFKAIFRANCYKPRRFDINAYKKVNVSHHLSSYEVALPIWDGEDRIFKPFQPWANGKPIGWYRAYNESKHDRHEAFKLANLHTLVTAVAGLLVLMTAQFMTEDFSAGADQLLGEGHDYHELEPALGSLFRIKYPDDWSEDEIYEFDWTALSKEEVRFAEFDYNAL